MPYRKPAEHVQVLAMVLRSGAKHGQPRPAPAEEIDYCTRLNRVLPPDIRVLGWTDVANDFHARCVRLLSR
jgi:tRNA pseudouridine38/39 synthase